MNEDLPTNPGVESEAVFSRQRLKGFEIYHAYQITTEMGRLARGVEKQLFNPEKAATVKINSAGKRTADITFEVPMLRINRVGDVLSRDWIIFSNGQIYTCDSFLLTPDVLDISTLAHPEPRDVISDQYRIMERILTSKQAGEENAKNESDSKPSPIGLDQYEVPGELIRGIMARHRGGNSDLA